MAVSKRPKDLKGQVTSTLIMYLSKSIHIISAQKVVVVIPLQKQKLIHKSNKYKSEQTGKHTVGINK